MNKTNFKKVFSVFLSVLMILSCWVWVAPHEHTHIEANAALSSVKIVVPETIYLKPTLDTNNNVQYASVQYYVNNNSDGTAKKSAADETAYVNVSGAESYTVTVKASKDLTNWSTSTYDASSKKITALGVTLAEKETALVEWEFKCVVNGETETHYAYSVAYAPYVSPVGTSVAAVADKDQIFASSITWFSGVHGMEGNSAASDGDTTNYRAFPYKTGRYFVPLITGIADGEDNGDWPTNWFSQSSSADTLSDATIRYATRAASGSKFGMLVSEVSDYAKLTVDTSRYTNFNQIPNLTIGFMATDVDGSNDDGGIYWYVSDFTDNTGSIGATSKQDSGAGVYDNNHSAWFANSGSVYSGSTSAKSEVNYGAEYNASYDRLINSSSQKYIIKGALRSHYYSKSWIGTVTQKNAYSINYAYLDVTAVNKSTLRSTLYNETSLVKENYTAATWANYQQELRKAAYNLGNPMSTNVSTEALMGVTLDTTVTYDANGEGVTITSLNDQLVFDIPINHNETITYTQEDSQSLATATRPGYTFKGWSTNEKAIEPDANVVLGIHDTLYAVWEANNYNVMFDNLVNYEEWKNTIPADKVDAITLVDGGFAIKNETGKELTFNSPFFSVEPGKSYVIDADVSGGAWDIYIFFCDANDTWVDFADGETNRFSDSTTWDNIFTAPNKSEVVKAQIRIDANNDGETVKFENIRVYEEGTVADGVSYVAPITATYNSTYGTLPTPTREGYHFLKWVDADGNEIIKTGETVTITENTPLYSTWGKCDTDVVVPGKAATCTETGLTAGAKCSVCGTVTLEQTVTSALKHDWADATYSWTEIDGEWSCTATRACKRTDCGASETATATVASQVTTPATCENMGKTTYTATFDVAWATAQTKVEEDVAAIDHKWTVTYTWADDNSTCTATRVCGNDATHTDTVTVNATSEITTPATCTGKGKTTYTATFTGTAWAETQTKTLENVGSLDHDWAETTYEWVKNGDEWSCTATRVCKRTDCGASETATATVTSEVTTPAKCEDMGKTTYTATFTGTAWAAPQTKEVEDIPSTGHTEGEEVIEDNKLPTCTVDGSYDTVVYCSVCTAELSRVTTTVPALTHAWSETFVSDGNGADGTHYQVCTRDGCNEVNRTGHTWAEEGVVTPPSCTADGFTTYTCTANECGATKTENIVAAAHTYGELIEEIPATCTADGTKAHFTCSVCLKNFDENKAELADLTIPATNHPDKVEKPQQNATCLENGYTAGEWCPDCETWLSGHVTIPAIAHKNKVHHAKNPATCVATGTIEYWSCPDCSKNFSNEACQAEVTELTIDIDENAHDLENHDAKAPTCTEIGWDAYVTCKREGCSYSTYEENKKAAIAHKDKVHHAKNPATCVATGTIEYWSCPDCSKNFSDEACTTEVTVLTIAIDSNNHVNKIEDSGTAATCITVGYNAGTFCEDCDKWISGHETIPAIAHANSKLNAEVAATCSKTGTVAHWACPDCGKNFKDAEFTVELTDLTIAKNPANHVNKTEHTQTDATCLEVGYEAGTYCNDCKTWVSGHKEIPAIGHKNKEHHEKIDATCVATGTIEYWSCPDCDKNFLDEACAMEVTELTIDIDVNAHDLENYDAKAPTCTDIGWDAYVTCKREGCGHTTYAEKKALGHTEEKIPVVDATCTATGLTAGVKCSVCGVILNAQEKIPANGHTFGAYSSYINDKDGTHYQKCTACDYQTEATAHTWGEGTVETPAECTENGVMKYTCTTADCPGYYTEPIAATGHKDDDSNNKCDVCQKDICDHNGFDTITTDYKPANCTEAGYTGDERCEECNTIKKQGEVIPALGHNETHHEKIAAKCNAEGTIEYWSCSVCLKNFSDEACTKEVTDLTIPKDANNHANVVTDAAVPATCYSYGKTEGSHCEACNVVIVAQTRVDMLEHTWNNGVETSAATCKTLGVMTYTCTVDACKATKTVDIALDANNHENKEKELRNDKAATCTAEGYTGDLYWACCNTLDTEGTVIVIDKDAHTKETTHVEGRVEPTCTTPGQTGNELYDCCNAVKAASTIIPVDADAHTGTASVVKNAKIATCTEKGYTGDTYWSCCDALAKSGNEIDKDAAKHTGEANVVKNAKAATCTEKGYTGDTYWSCCDALAKSGNEIAIDTTNHTAKVDTNAVDPTCADKGYTAGVYCNACNKYVSGHEEVPVVDHKYETYTANDDATCQKNQTETASCVYGCRETHTREIANSKVGHKYETYVANDDATCQKNQTETANCVYDCGETHTRDIENSKVAHKYTNYVSDDNATCQKNCTETALCDYGCGANDTREIADSKVGHIEIDIPAVPATCKDTGLTAGKKCKDCGTITVPQTVIPTTDHSVVTDEAVAANCTEDGLTEGSHCSVCGTVIVAQEVIPSKGGHVFDRTKYESNLTRPQAGQPGYYTYPCKNEGCDATETEEVPGADYSSYNKVIDAVNKLMQEDIPAEDKAKLQEILDNPVSDRLTADEQTILDAVVEDIMNTITEVNPDSGFILEIAGPTKHYAGTVLGLEAVKVNGDMRIPATNVQWTSSNDSVVFFSNGKLIAIGTGTVTLTATSGLLTATKTVTIVEGGNIRRVNFTPMANMHFIVEDYFAVFNGANMNWSDDYEIRFRVYTYSSFAFETYIVYINGVEAVPDENGYYTVPANAGEVRVTISGAVYDKDGEGSGGTGKFNFWEWLINLFRKIIQFFKDLFGVA